MSSGNKLSISICDDNGNLSYQKQFRVRRVIQRGVIDDEQGVSLDMDELGYKIEKNEWIADPDKTTGKFLLIAEYDSGRDDETDIGTLIPMTREGIAYRFDDMLHSQTVYVGENFFAHVEGSADEWIIGENCCLEARTSAYNVSLDYAEKFDSVKISDGVVYAKAKQHTGFDIVSNSACIIQTFKGRRWLCVMPLTISVSGYRILFRRKINGGLIRYFVVEVEE